MGAGGVWLRLKESVLVRRWERGSGGGGVERLGLKVIGKREGFLPDWWVRDREGINQL